MTSNQIFHLYISWGNQTCKLLIKLMQDLLDHQQFISDTIVVHVLSRVKSIFTNSNMIYLTTSLANPVFSSRTICQSLISVTPSTNMPHSSYPLITLNVSSKKYITTVDM